MNLPDTATFFLLVVVPNRGQIVHLFSHHHAIQVVRFSLTGTKAPTTSSVHMPQRSSSPIAVERKESLEVVLIGHEVVTWSGRIVHTGVEVCVVEVLVQMWKAKTVTDLCQGEKRK